jgi:hypothetical protein
MPDRCVSKIRPMLAGAARAAAVKNGRTFGGRPQGLFLRAASTAA